MCAKDRPRESVEDVWGDDDSDSAEEQSELDREWEARHQHFYNAGYREGLDEGKELTLQHGFDAGFAEGAHAGFEFGMVRGALQTLAALYKGSEEQTAQIQQLLQQVCALPNQAVMRDTCTALLAQPVAGDLVGQLTAALQQLDLAEGEKLPDPSDAVEDLSAAVTNAAAGSSSSSSSVQAAKPLPLQLVAHTKQQLKALGFDVGAAPALPAAVEAAAATPGQVAAAAAADSATA